MEEQKIKNVPEKIYLVLGLDKDELMEDEDFKTLENVSWCQNRVSEADIEYVLAQPLSVPIQQDKEKGISENEKLIAGNYIKKYWDNMDAYNQTLIRVAFIDGLKCQAVLPISDEADEFLIWLDKVYAGLEVEKFEHGKKERIMARLSCLRDVKENYLRKKAQPINTISNAILPIELHEQYKKGYKDGYADGSEPGFWMQ